MPDEPIEINKLVDYQDGSVVSRTLIDKPTGTVTIFAFSQDQGLSEHKAPYDALVQVVDGKASIMIGKKVFTVTSGQVLLLPANIPHSLKATTNFKMLLTMIKA